MIMNSHRYQPMKAECISITNADSPKMTLTGAAWSEGVRNAHNYDAEQLMAMLHSSNIYEVYEALGALRKLRLKEALRELYSMALYDDDLSVRREAIRIIKLTGGKKAKEMVRALQLTEHREFVIDLVEGTERYSIKGVF